MIEILEAARRAEQFRLHPLGFFYLQKSVGEGRTQRVHVWLPGGDSKTENDRHQHSFDIESVIVTGRMKSELFRFEEKQEGPEVEYAIFYDGHKSILRQSGRRGVLVPVTCFETVAGAGYRLEAGVIHRVAAIETPCITIVQTLDRGIPIFSYGREDEAISERRQCTESEASALRQYLLSAVDK